MNAPSRKRIRVRIADGEGNIVQDYLTDWDEDGRITLKAWEMGPPGTTYYVTYSEVEGPTRSDMSDPVADWDKRVWPKGPDESV